MRALLTYKLSTLEYSFPVEQREEILKLQDPGRYRDVILGYRTHRASLEFLRRALTAYSLTITEQLRGQPFDERDYDLIIAAGGDGTLLETAHQVRRTPLLGVNSSPETSIGHYCCCNAYGIQPVMDALMAGHGLRRYYARLKVKKNGAELPQRALNDVLFSHTSPAGMSACFFGIDGRLEDVKSSGIWVATPAGSTGGIASAGGRRLSWDDRVIQYVVREAYRAPRFPSAVLPPETVISIIPKTFETAIYLDGVKGMVGLTFGDEVEITMDEHPLEIVWTP